MSLLLCEYISIYSQFFCLKCLILLFAIWKKNLSCVRIKIWCSASFFKIMSKTIFLWLISKLSNKSSKTRMLPASLNVPLSSSIANRIAKAIAVNLASFKKVCGLWINCFCSASFGSINLAVKLIFGLCNFLSRVLELTLLLKEQFMDSVLKFIAIGSLKWLRK